jgi:hypothetical protein
MPLVQLYKPLATSALAGSIVTAFFAAGTAVLIYKNCIHFKVPNWATYLMVVLYAFNPFIFLYGSNGMSEAIFIFFIVLTITELVRWIGDEKWMHLVWMGIAMALAFLTRYEAIPFAAAVFLTLAFFAIKKCRLQLKSERDNNDDNNSDDGNGKGKSIRSYFEGTAIVVFMPLVTSVVLWVLVNWVIMGDPLYFMTSQYSASVQAEVNLPSNIQAIVGDAGAVFIFVLKKSIAFVPLLIFILLLRIYDKRFLRWETFMLLALAFSITAFHFVSIYTGGSSYGWLRFFVYPLPVALAWLLYEFSKINGKSPSFNKLAASFCCVALVISNVLIGAVLNNSSIASEEYNTYMQGEQNVQVQEEVADYINENCSDGIILMDSFQTWYVIMNLDSTGNLITTCSYPFEAALEDPSGYNVKYILTIANYGGLGVLDAVNVRYPDLYENGADWCTLVMEWDACKLYEVIY